MNLGVPSAPSADAGGGVVARGGKRPPPAPQPLRRAPVGRPARLPHGPPAPHPPRLLPGLPPADLPIAPLGPAAARFPFLFQEPRGRYELDPELLTVPGARAHLPPGWLPLPAPRPPARPPQPSGGCGAGAPSAVKRVQRLRRDGRRPHSGGDPAEDCGAHARGLWVSFTLRTGAGRRLRARARSRACNRK